MKTLQLNDPDIGFLLTVVTHGEKPSSRDMLKKSQASRHYWIIWETLVVKEDALYRVFRKANGTNEYCQLIVPHTYKSDVVSLAHDSIIGGHMGVRKTKAKILTHFYWYNLNDSIKHHIRGCDTCAAGKKPPKNQRATIGKIAHGSTMGSFGNRLRWSFPHYSTWE